MLNDKIRIIFIFFHNQVDLVVRIQIMKFLLPQIARFNFLKSWKNNFSLRKV